MTVIGSDEENGMTKAMREVFHAATHLLCVKHLKDIVDYMHVSSWNIILVMLASIWTPQHRHSHYG